jgi:transaldolase
MIIGSIRDPFDVGDAFSAGAHIVTIPPKILEKMVFNQKTKETLEQFDQAWKDFQALRNKRRNKK